MLDEVLNISLNTDAQISEFAFNADFPATDEQLVAAILAGDEPAFAEIFDRHKRRVTGVVGKFFREKNDIEEFVQQCFTKAYFSLNKFQGGNARSFPAWITKIAVNVCYDEFRRRQRQNVNQNETENDFLETVPDGRAISAESTIIAAELAKKILSSLSPEDRVALTMIYSEEYSLEEVAGVMGITTSSLKSRLFRCRNQLKTKFGYLFK